MWTPSDALLARYIAGECSPDEIVEVERWAEYDPAHRARLATLRAIWEARGPTPAWDVQAIWTGVRRTMRAGRTGPVPFGRGPAWGGARRWLSVPVAAAAVVLLTIGTGFAFLYWSETAPAVTADDEPAREYATGRGQRATLQLPDGTRLLLAPDSRLRIPASFGRATREVFLEGEALFDVVHDTTRPFRVQAKHAVAEDIGTRFDIRAYPEDSTVAVAVAEGVVALGRAAPPPPADASAGPATQGVVLQQGELGTLGPAGQVTTARGAALAEYLAWADGRLVFADAPLGEASARLSRWYNIDVRLDSPALGARRLTATFANESAAEALRFVATVLNLQVVRTDHGYTLSTK